MRGNGPVMAGAVVMVLVLLPGRQAQVQGENPSAPPAGLNSRQQARLNQLERELEKALADRALSRVLATAREALTLRERWQGDRHWQTINTRWAVKRFEQLTRLPPKDQSEVLRSIQLTNEGDALARNHDYQAAAARYRQALAIKRKTLGEEHHDTALSYINAAVNLHAQGKYNEAQPLFWKALTLLLKVLGEEHPDTATSYNYVAYNLQANGKYVEAQPHFAKALVLRRKVLGEEHPDTATSYNNVAFNLQAQGKYVAAQPIYEKALALERKMFGDEHLNTATSCNNLGYNLYAQSKYDEARPLFEKSLDLRRKLLGEENLNTANSYNNLACALGGQGKYAEAQPLLEKSLAIDRKLLGEEHPSTASRYSNLAGNLNSQGKYLEAQPIYEKALTLYRKSLGEEHPDTASSYNNVAFNLNAQGKYAEARPLFERALAIRRKVLGEEHPSTASSYNNVAFNLNSQSKYAEAQPLFEKALALYGNRLGAEHPDTVNSLHNLAGNLHAQGKYLDAQLLYERTLFLRRKRLGEEHLETASSYNSLATNLNAQGKYAEAQPLFEKALALRRKRLGEEHPYTATSYNNLAYNLNALGKYADALPFYEKALAVRRKLLGEEHPRTALSYNNLAYNLWKQDRVEEAVKRLHDSMPGQEAVRYQRASSGFDRALGGAEKVSPHALLAVGLARLNQPAHAFVHAEAHLSRGLLEDLAPTARADTLSLSSLTDRLHRLDQQLLPLYGSTRLSSDQKNRREYLLQQRRLARAQLSRLAAAASTEQLLSQTAIQKQLRPDSALLLWLDIDSLGAHHACILRSAGDPVWVRLTGSDTNGAWSVRDTALSDRLYRLLRQPNPRDEERQRLTRDLAKQRFEPLRRHLGARGRFPAVKHLLVVPTGWVARVPMEVLATGYRISYVPSGSVYVRLKQRHRSLEGASLLALGNPAFNAPAVPQPAPPSRGLLVTFAQPAGSAFRAGVRGGDVLVQMGQTRLASRDDLIKALAQGGSLRFWREGADREARLSDGPLGIRLDARPAPQAVRAWREAAASVVRGGPTPAALPGTRWEVESLARLVPQHRTLLGSDASEQLLDALARTGKLKEYRLLHLATHGIIHPERPEWSALLLARDRLPDPREQVRQGKPIYTGELRVDAIRKWHLDADLVSLSACETGLGAEGNGDGLLGFAQAFLQSGARSVVLSRWSADDTATALLMLRFYENLLGKRSALKKPLPRAEALAEARQWLRQLRRSDALVLASRLSGGKLAHTTRGTEEEWTVAGSADKVPVPVGDRPYAHPAYWAAFVLVGDPD